MCSHPVNTHSNYVESYYWWHCIAFLPVLSLSFSFSKVLQYQSAHRSDRIRRSYSFSAAFPKIWNSLPPALRSYNCPDTFRRHLKTYYFQQAFSSPMYLHPCPSDSAFADIVRVYKFHLLKNGIRLDGSRQNPSTLQGDMVEPLSGGLKGVVSWTCIVRACDAAMERSSTWHRRSRLR